MTDPRLLELDAPITNANYDVLEGMEHFSAISEGSTETLSQLLCGRLDYTLRCVFFTLNCQRKPEVVRDLMDSDITQALELLKEDIRSGLMAQINRNAEDDCRKRKSAQQLQFEQTATQFRAMSQPAPEGTVAELAERYGLSKTQIRQLKRENRLHELTQQ